MSSGSVQIEGDTTLAQQFAKALGGLDVDWEEQAARVLGDPIAHQVGQAMKGLSDWGRQTSRTLTADLKEYLEEEGRLVPTRYELDAFLAEVDTLRDDVERLEARLARLNQAAAAPTPDSQPSPTPEPKPAPKKATARKKAPAKKTSKPGDRPG
jgi:ubiquinone biosynthesis protein UbiJ